MRKKLGFNNPPERDVVDEFDERDDYLDSPTEDVPPTPTTPPPTGDDLWDTYKIKSAWPERTKIEVLNNAWRLSTAAIADILGIQESAVVRVLKEIEDEFRQLGKKLGPDEKAIERGKLIAELEKVKEDLDRMIRLSPDPDPKVLAQKVAVIEKLAKLRGVDQDKHMGEAEINENQAFEDRINALPVDKLQALKARTQKPDQEEE